MKLAEITAKYISQPFKKYDCIELVASVLADLGRPLPNEVDGISLLNYRELVEQDIRRAEYRMLRCFRKIGVAGNAKCPAIGDLLVILQKTRPGLFPAVYLGGGVAIASFIRTGVAVFKLDAYNLPVMARRVA